jgi:hypothetical protein
LIGQEQPQHRSPLPQKFSQFDCWLHLVFEHTLLARATRFFGSGRRRARYDRQVNKSVKIPLLSLIAG